MTEEVVAQPGSNSKSKVLRKFLELYPRFAESKFEEGRFADYQVQELYMVFLAGWQSHPQFGVGPVSIIGEITDTGVKFAGEPRMHTNQSRALREKERLEHRLKKKFAIFTCRDVDGLLTPMATKVYQDLMEKAGPKIQEKKLSLDFKAIKARFFALSAPARTFVMSAFPPSYTRLQGTEHDIEVRRLKHLRHTGQLTRLVERLEMAERIVTLLSVSDEQRAAEVKLTHVTFGHGELAEAAVQEGEYRVVFENPVPVIIEPTDRSLD
jgi:hypothetical protein